MTATLERLNPLNDGLERLKQRDARLEHQSQLAQHENAFGRLQAAILAVGLGGDGGTDPDGGQAVAGQTSDDAGFISGSEDAPADLAVAADCLVLERQLPGVAHSPPPAMR